MDARRMDGRDVLLSCGMSLSLQTIIWNISFMTSELGRCGKQSCFLLLCSWRLVLRVNKLRMNAAKINLLFLPVDSHRLLTQRKNGQWPSWPVYALDPCIKLAASGSRTQDWSTVWPWQGSPHAPNSHKQLVRLIPQVVADMKECSSKSLMCQKLAHQGEARLESLLFSMKGGAFIHWSLCLQPEVVQPRPVLIVLYETMFTPNRWVLPRKEDVSEVYPHKDP